MCWHKYIYIGYVDGYYWLAGVTGGIEVPCRFKAKECTKCGKVKEVK